MITIFWIYRGFKVGLYPSLNMFFVFFLALLITLNYFDLWIPVIGRIAPRTSPSVRQCISLIFTYLLTFGLFLYLTLWLCAERVWVQKWVDRIGGGIVGAAAGLACCAAILFIWFSFPFAERAAPVDKGTMFFPAHSMIFRAITFIGDRISSEDAPEFEGERFLRDLRFGLTSIPSVGSGIYVSSIPAGLSVFYQEGGRGAETFYKQMKERLKIPESDLTPSERRRPFGRRGVTPIFIDSGGTNAMIAVMMEGLPPELEAATSGALERFRPDGEVGVAETYIVDQKLFVKVYNVEKHGTVGSIIALFEPKPPELRDMVNDFLPLRECFPLTEQEEQRLIYELKNVGATSEEADTVARQVRQGGKALFTGFEEEDTAGEQLMAAEMISRNTWRIYPVSQPTNLEAAMTGRVER